MLIIRPSVFVPVNCGGGAGQPAAPPPKSHHLHPGRPCIRPRVPGHVSAAGRHRRVGGGASEGAEGVGVAAGGEGGGGAGQLAQHLRPAPPHLPTSHLTHQGTPNITLPNYL